MPPARLEHVAPSPESVRMERPIVGALMVVWRGRWIIALCILLGTAYSSYKIVNYTPLWKASAQILLKQPPSMFNPMMENSNDTAGYLYEQCVLLHSSAILTEARSFPGVDDTDCLRNAPDPVAFLKSNVYAGPEEKGSLITVWMKSQNPTDAETIVNAVVKAYTKYQSQQEEKTYAGVTKIIGARIEALTTEQRDLQLKLTDFKKAHPEFVSESEPGKAGSQVQQMLFDAQNKQREFDLAVKEAAAYGQNATQLKHLVDEVNNKCHLPPDTDPVLDPSIVAQVNQTRLSLIGQAPKNPMVEALTAKLKSLEAELKRENDAAVVKYNLYLNAELNASIAAVKESQKNVNEERSAKIGSFSVQADYDMMQLQKSQTERELERLEGQLRPLESGRGDVGALTVSVLEWAKPTPDPDAPKRFQTLMTGVVGGIMVGLGGALLLEMLEQRLRSVEEVVKLLTYPVLGSVPHILPRSEPMNKNVLRSPWLRYLKSALGRRSQIAETLKQRGQIMHLSSRTDVAEAYRTIRTAIYFGLAGHTAKSILVTSPSAGDGKSTLASNLSIAIAQSGRRVLLIDADCWHPAQNAIFEIEDSHGLTDVLEGKSAFADVVHKTGVPNLDLMTCGKIPENPSELLGGSSWTELLAHASEQYDQVLIDSPPVVPITDARILAASAAATILVLRADKSTRRHADDACEALTSVGATVLGIVVNDVPRRSSGRSYQYYQYAADRGARNWGTRGTNGNGQHRSSNGNGHVKHLPPGNIIDADVTEVDSDRK